MSTVKNNYSTFIKSVSDAKAKCKHDILSIGEHLLESKYRKLNNNFENSIDNHLYVKFITEVLQIFTYTYLVTYEPILPVRVGVIRYIKDIFNSNRNIVTQEHNNILHRCIKYFNVYDRPVFDDISCRVNLYFSILTLEDSDPYKADLVSKYRLFLDGMITINDLRLLIDSILGNYDNNVLIPREAEQIRENRDKHQPTKKAEELKKPSRTVDPNKNADYWDFSNFYEGQEFTGKSFKKDYTNNLIVAETGTPPCNKNGKPFTGNSQNAIIRESKRKMNISVNEQNHTIRVLEIYDCFLDRKEVDGRTNKKGIYRIPLKVIILIILLQNGLQLQIPQGRFKQMIMQFSLSTFFRNISLEYYQSIFPNVKYSDLEDTITYNRNATERRFRININTALDSIANDREFSHLINIYRQLKVATRDEHNKRIFIQQNQDSSIAIRNIKANKWALNQIQIYDAKKRCYRSAKNESDLYKYNRWKEFEEYKEEFIKSNYGWDYIFTELSITADDNNDVLSYIFKILNSPDEVTINDLLEDSITQINNAVKKSVLESANRKYSDFIHNVEQERMEIQRQQIEYERIFQNLYEMNHDELLENNIDISVPDSVYKPVYKKLPDMYVSIAEHFINLEIDKATNTDKQKYLSLSEQIQTVNE